MGGEQKRSYNVASLLYVSRLGSGEQLKAKVIATSLDLFRNPITGVTCRQKPVSRAIHFHQSINHQLWGVGQSKFTSPDFWQHCELTSFLTDTRLLKLAEFHNTVFLWKIQLHKSKHSHSFSNKNETVVQTKIALFVIKFPPSYRGTDSKNANIFLIVFNQRHDVNHAILKSPLASVKATRSAVGIACTIGFGRFIQMSPPVGGQ